MQGQICGWLMREEKGQNIINLNICFVAITAKFDFFNNGAQYECVKSFAIQCDLYLSCYASLTYEMSFWYNKFTFTHNSCTKHCNNCVLTCDIAETLTTRNIISHARTALVSCKTFPLLSNTRNK